MLLIIGILSFAIPLIFQVAYQQCLGSTLFYIGQILTVVGAGLIAFRIASSGNIGYWFRVLKFLLVAFPLYAISLIFIIADSFTKCYTSF